MATPRTSRSATATAFSAGVLPVRLSDGSISHNVIWKAYGVELVLAAESEEHADELAKAINNCAWIERA